MKFRKKPVVIEAFQMTHERRHDNSEWPYWLNRAWNTVWPLKGAVSFVGHVDGTFQSQHPYDDRLCISTLEGVMTVDWNDWIIRGVDGELYACKPDIFAKTYELVKENS